MAAASYRRRRPGLALVAPGGIVGRLIGLLVGLLNGLAGAGLAVAQEAQDNGSGPGAQSSGQPEWALRPGGGMPAGGAMLKTKAASVIVTGIDIGALRKRTLVTLTMKGRKDPPAVRFLADPNRALVDLADARFDISRLANATGQRGSAVSLFRFGQIDAGKARIVFDLGFPVRLAATKSQATQNEIKFIYELERVSQSVFMTDIKSAAAPAQAAAAPSGQSLGPDDQRPLVVLDPGHGGIDPGARGRNAKLEKNVVLAFATVLARHLRESGRYHVLMTRSDDRFVPLAERVRLARQAGAKLFISIHADTLDAASVSGATVYTVSDRASDAHAAKLAEKENLADKLAGYEAAEETSEVSDILFDLARRETRTLSHYYARSLVAYWKGAGSLNKNPIRSAGFRVLMAPDVPSVLLELGYLSSKTEAALLASPEWRTKAAGMVAASVDSFFDPNGRKRDSASHEQKAELLSGMAGPGNGTGAAENVAPSTR